jgi:hypothetical protein
MKNNTEYDLMLARATELALIDPMPDTPEGAELIAITAALVSHERQLRSTDIESGYATAERESDGTYTLYNTVTGLMSRTGLDFDSAWDACVEIDNFYRSKE